MNSEEASVDLSARLLELRTAAGLKQKAIADALGVGVSIVSSWENGKKTPSERRVTDYARFFAGEEHTEFESLRRELLHLHATATGRHPDDLDQLPDLWRFPDGGPVRIICGELPDGEKTEYADPANANFMRLSAYADLDAMVELFSHIRALNPHSDVQHKLTAEPDDLQAHLVLLGGAALNDTTRDVVRQADFPVSQVPANAEIPNGEWFEIPGGGRVDAVFADEHRAEVVEDVGLFIRLPNPNNVARTLTICGGVMTRGVFGAVRCFTDAAVGDRNTDYAKTRFGSIENFGLLMRVPVIGAMPATPDLHNPDSRLYEWPAG
ncbi:helix-turn-helix domain-containing protein [Amycolatopsis sp. NPDC059657]|uniref:helix-turn-helix domain-containing protein n=1 Tax=Amycolatopsis sp. NPDC059657 TaxID=3346899 RepID=UPI00366D1F13